MLKKVILAFIGLLSSVSLVVAAPVKIPTGKDGDSVLADFCDGKLRLSTGVEYDNVFERKLDAFDTTVEFNAILAEVAVEYEQNTRGYVVLGQARNIEAKKLLGVDLNANFEDSLMWGVGLTGKSSVLLEVVDIFTDISYRQTANMDYDSVSILGTTYSKSDLGGNTNADWKEWHLAFGITKDFKYFTPYAGVRYSDVETSLKFSAGGTDYNLGTANSDKKVGVFVGTMISPIKDVNINIQGRFIDEEALTVSAAWIF
ncbi:MAG: hypothetical protein H6755_07845 [Candidatus Omnitrophica bacterium]|nr:hypothetical protein [Candidatus Omnitrophota bacterium]